MTPEVSLLRTIYPALLALLFRRSLLPRRIAAFALILFGLRPAAATLTEAWVARFDNVLTNGTDIARKAAQDAEGNLIVLGTIDDGNGHGRDLLTIKYSGVDGAILWQTRYNGPANRDDEAKAIAVDNVGNIIITGSSSGGQDDLDYYTAKYAAGDGTLLWERRYDGPGDAGGFGQSDEPVALAADLNGNVVVTGFSRAASPSISIGFYTAKYASSDGALIWGKRYQGAGGLDRPRAVAVDPDGNVFVAGISYTPASSFDFYIVKYAATDGALIWEKRYNGPHNYNDEVAGLKIDRAGNVVVAGTTYNEQAEGQYYTAKYATADGQLIWQAVSDTGRNDMRAIGLDPQDNVVVTGVASQNGLNESWHTVKYGSSSGAVLWDQRSAQEESGDYSTPIDLTVDNLGNVIVTGNSVHSNNPDFYTVKYSGDGQLLWEKRYNAEGDGNDEVSSVLVDRGGNIFVTGTSYDPNSFGDWYNAKYAPENGSLLWQNRYNSAVSAIDGANSIAVDMEGNVVVAGYSWNKSNSDLFAAKYASANGALLWAHRFNGPFDLDDEAKAVAVDGNGDVIVAGTTGFNFSSSFDIGADFYTAKYAGANGTLIWEKRYDGPSHSTDQCAALAIDKSGNVIVTGSSYDDRTQFDYYTAKYAAADGALIWEKRSNASGAGQGDSKDDYAAALALDTEGNVVVTGTSRNGSPNYDFDFYTAKYSATDGTLLWENRFNGPGSASDGATAIALDRNGNVFVTGYSSGPLGSNPDYYTAKYAASDGLLVWENRHDGSIYSEHFAQALTLDSAGNAVVTGLSFGTNPFSDCYTAKYAASDGALLWEQHYNGPANNSDGAQAIASDNAGHLFVSGYSYSDQSKSSLLTLEYDPAGNQISAMRYAGLNTVPFGNYALDIALDNNGNVFVTGVADGDLVVIKYSQTNISGLPTIATQPQSQVIKEGATSTFEVLVQGSTPLSYQWRFNGADLVDATNRTLVLSNAQDFQAGNYSVRVDNSLGTISSPDARLTILTPVTITIPPRRFDGFVGGTFSLSVGVRGSGPLSYQWFFNGQPVSGGTNSNLRLENLMLSQAGFYSVAVSNSFSSIHTGEFELTVVPLLIVHSPQDGSIVAGNTFVFEIEVRSASPISYQWQRNGTNIPGATNAELFFPKVDITDAGLYSVILSNQLDSITTAGSRLTVVSPAAIGNWNLRDSGTLRDLYGITFAQEVFVAVGDAGTILLSHDGSGWLPQSSGTQADLHAVHYSGSLFVAVGQGGTILVSEDGVTWIESNSSIGSSLKDVTYGNGVYISVGSAGTILTSKDGTNWVARNSPSKEDLNGVTFANGTFVAVGDGKTATNPSVILRSSDGETWESAFSGTSKNLRSITYANNNFVVAGNDGTILISSDGVLWKNANVFLCSALNLRGLTFGNGLFVTVGNAAPPLINAALAISSDATTWTCWKSETLSNLHQVAFGKGSFIAVGSSGVILQSPNFANAQLSLRGGINGEVLELFVSGEIGRDYMVQSNNLLGSPSWVDVFSFHTTEPNTRVSLDPPALGNPQRFYRVVSP